MKDGQKRGVSMEKSTAGMNKRSPDCLSQPNQNTILINIKLYSFIRSGKKYNGIKKIQKQNELK